MTKPTRFLDNEWYVYWRSSFTGFVGHGEAMTLEEAESAVDALNKPPPLQTGLYHWVQNENGQRPGEFNGPTTFLPTATE